MSDLAELRYGQATGPCPEVRAEWLTHDYVISASAKDGSDVEIYAHIPFEGSTESCIKLTCPTESVIRWAAMKPISS